MPFLEDVHAVVGHHAQLGIRDGDEVLFVERLTARDAVINYSRIAGRLPLHVTSSGLVLLAYGAPDAAGAGAGPAAAAVHRPDARARRTQLRAALAEVRRQGFALLPGHVHEEATGIAVPVRDALGEVVAGLSVIVPNDGRAAAHVPVLLAAARGLSRTPSRRPALSRRVGGAGRPRARGPRAVRRPPSAAQPPASASHRRHIRGSQWTTTSAVAAGRTSAAAQPTSRTGCVRLGGREVHLDDLAGRAGGGVPQRDGDRGAVAGRRRCRRGSPRSP